MHFVWLATVRHGQHERGKRCICFSQLLSRGLGHPHRPPVPQAADWGRYGNARFGYRIDIPPGFSSVREADNGDGGISLRADGRSRLLVWRNAIAAGPDFPSDVASRIDRDKADGWSITYQKRSSGWAAWSARKGDRILYQRGIPLYGGKAAYFRLEYDRWQTVTFNSQIPKLVKSLRGDEHSAIETTRHRKPSCNLPLDCDLAPDRGCRRPARQPGPATGRSEWPQRSRARRGLPGAAGNKCSWFGFRHFPPSSRFRGCRQRSNSMVTYC